MGTHSKQPYKNVLFSPFGEEPKQPAPLPSDVISKPARAGYDIDRKIDKDSYREWIQFLREKIDTPKYKDKVLMIDLSEHPEEQDVTREIEKFYNPSQKTDDILKFLKNNFVFDRSVMPPPEGRGGVSFSSEHHIHDPDHWALVLANHPDMTTRGFLSQALYGENHIFERANISIEKWAQNFDISFLQKYVNAHELMHGISGNPGPETGETLSLYIRRREVTADVGSLLLLAQKGEPDLDRQIQALIHMRDVEKISHAHIVNDGQDHHTGDTLRQLAKDLPRLMKDQNFSRMSLDDIRDMADRYTKKDLQKDYPHLYGKDVRHKDRDALEHKTSMKDAELGSMNAQMFNIMVNEPRGRPFPPHDRMTPRQAEHLLRTSDSLSVISGHDNHPLGNYVKMLRAEHPGFLEKVENDMRLKESDTIYNKKAPALDDERASRQGNRLAMAEL